MYTADTFNFRHNMEKTNRKRCLKNRKKDTAATVTSSKSQPPLKQKQPCCHENDLVAPPPRVGQGYSLH